MSALKTVIKLVRAANAPSFSPKARAPSTGSCSPRNPGSGLVIAKTLAPVVPMRIFGAHEAFPRGAKYPYRTPITLVVGEPMRFTEADLATAKAASFTSG